MTNPDPTTVAANIQPVINAAETVLPTTLTTGAKAWFKRYIKGWIVLIGSVASLALAYLPSNGNLFHYASVIVTAVTIIGVVEVDNGI